MYKLRKSNQRGLGAHGWLHSLHSFSFADYYDPENMGFRSLRVINEDRIDGGSGFGSHPHRDMEIISYVISGALEHKDSMGNSTVIRPDEVQRMSAGSGVVHSEFNKEQDEQTHFFQIWIQPNLRGAPPGYAQKSFAKELSSQNLVLVVSQEGRLGSLPIQQDADLYIARMKQGHQISFDLRKGRGLWLQMVHGILQVQIGAELVKLEVGDGISISNESKITLKAESNSEILLFDLA